MNRPGILEQLRAEEASYLRKLDECRADIERLEGRGRDGEPWVVPLSALREHFREKPTRFLVGNVMPGTSIGMLAAYPQTGKTTALVQLALCLTNGRHFLDWRIERPAKTLVVCMEGARDLFADRCASTGRLLGLTPEEIDLVRFHSWVAKDFQIGRPGLERMIDESSAEFVILDTVRYFRTGGDENNADDFMRYVMEPLHKLSEKFGATFCLVHHYSKSGQGVSGPDKLRGSSAMWGDLDWIWQIESSDADAEQQAERDRNPVRDRKLIVSKNRFGPTGVFDCHADLAKAIFYRGVAPGRPTPDRL